MTKLKVDNRLINYIKIDNEDYISITDMIKSKDGDFFVSDWLRNRNTIEFLGIWEKLNNNNFNLTEFDQIKNASGSNAFVMTTTKWVKETNAIGIKPSRGKYSEGTFAHRDIALELATISGDSFSLSLLKKYATLYLL